MSKQYIHIDSSFRNRLLYPNPSDFVIPYVSPTGMNIQTYLNPVSAYLPLYNFVFPECDLSESIDFFNIGYIVTNSSVKISIVGGTSLQIFLDADELESFIGSFQVVDLDVQSLVGLLFVYGASSPYQSAEIIGFDCNTSSITLSTPIVLNLPSTGYGYIYNNSTSSSVRVNGDLQNVLVYDISSLFLYNANLNETRAVTFLNNRILELEQPFSSNWTVNDFYFIIRYRYPIVYKLLPYTDTDSEYYCSTGVKMLRLLKHPSNNMVYGKVYELYFADTMTQCGVSIRWIRSLTNRCFEIVTHGVHVSNGDLLITADGLLSFQVCSAYQVFQVEGKLPASYINTFFTPFVLTPLFKDGSEKTYNVFPLRFSSYENPPSNYQELQNITGTAIIYGIDYDVNKNRSYIYVNPYDTELVERLNNTSLLPSWWNECLFSPNSAEQYSPLNYSGSTVSSDESVCYEIELVNLVFPNTFLNGLKVLTSFFPYFLVEFSNLSNSFQNTNTLLTNNPNAQRALFPIPISDVSSPIISQFLNLTCPCSQIVKFKPNDSFHIRIFYPNGETLTTFNKDTILPYSPDPLLQISAVFSIKRCV